MKTSIQRCKEMICMNVAGDVIVKRLSAEFIESFWVNGGRVMEEYRDSDGRPARRCIGTTA